MGRRLYRLLLGERTILFWGYCLLAGIPAYWIGKQMEVRWLELTGAALVAPFTITLLVIVFAVAPWMWLRSRG